MVRRRYTGNRYGRRLGESRRFRSRLSERLELRDTVKFVLQSMEDPQLLVSIDDADSSAVDDNTGTPFTDSMDERIAMVFDDSKDAFDFVVDKGITELVRVIPVEVISDEEIEDEELPVEESSRWCRMRESLRSRRRSSRRR